MLRIHITDLRRGMYVVDRGLRGFAADSRVYSVEGFILSETEGPALRAQGYTSAFVDEKYSPELKKNYNANDSDCDYIAPGHELPDPLALVVDEIGHAIKARECILDHARELAQMVAAKPQAPLGDISEHIEPMLASLERNSNALLALTLLCAKDDYTFTHGVDVAVLGSVLGRQLGVDPCFVRELGMAGFLHDIGKLFVPQKILNHPGRINDAQFQSMRRHAEHGYKYLSGQSGMSEFILGGVLDHHERYDGNGYPNRKKNKEISLSGRIIAVADVYDALSSQRNYRTPLTPQQALRELYVTRENDFAPGYVEALVAAIGVYPPGSPVELSDKSLAVVTECTQDQLRPRVVILTDGNGNQITPRYVDLFTTEEPFVNKPLPSLPFKVDVIEAIRCAD